jgi:lysophospholipase L1-like esterase
LKEAGVASIFASHPALDPDERVREAIREQAARSSAIYVDTRALFSDESQYAFGDRIHPDREGHRRLAALLVAPIKSALCGP